MEALGNINLLAVVAAIFASFIFGGIYFGVVVAKSYPLALGREVVPGQKPAPIYIFGPVVCNIFVVLTSAILIKMLNIETIEGAIGFGALVGIGYLLSTVMNVAINPNFPRPFYYSLLNAPYFLVSSLMTSVILVLMK